MKNKILPLVLAFSLLIPTSQALAQKAKQQKTQVKLEQQESQKQELSSLVENIQQQLVDLNFQRYAYNPKKGCEKNGEHTGYDGNADLGPGEWVAMDYWTTHFPNCIPGSVGAIRMDVAKNNEQCENIVINKNGLLKYNYEKKGYDLIKWQDLGNKKRTELQNLLEKIVERGITPP